MSIVKKMSTIILGLGISLGASLSMSVSAVDVSCFKDCHDTYNECGRTSACGAQFQACKASCFANG